MDGVITVNYSLSVTNRMKNTIYHFFIMRLVVGIIVVDIVSVDLALLRPIRKRILRQPMSAVYVQNVNGTLAS